MARDTTLTQGANAKLPRSIQLGTPVWWGKWGRSTLKDTPQLYYREHQWPIRGLSVHGPRPLSYLAQPSMRLRRYGWGWMSCGKLTMHWGLCWRAWDSLEWYPPQSPQRLWAWWAYMIQTHCTTAMGWPTALGVGRRAKWGHSHQPPLDSAL